MHAGSQALNKFMKHDLTACDSRLVQAFPNAQVKQGNANAEHVAIRLTEQWLNVHEKEGVPMQELLPVLLMCSLSCCGLRKMAKYKCEIINNLGR